MKDSFDEILRKKASGFEQEVPEKLWTSLSSHIPAAPATVTTGGAGAGVKSIVVKQLSTSVAKVVVALATTTATVGGYLAVKESGESTTTEEPELVSKLDLSSLEGIEKLGETDHIGLPEMVASYAEELKKERSVVKPVNIRKIEPNKISGIKKTTGHRLDIPARITAGSASKISSEDNQRPKPKKDDAWQNGFLSDGNGGGTGFDGKGNDGQGMFAEISDYKKLTNLVQQPLAFDNVADIPSYYIRKADNTDQSQYGGVVIRRKPGFFHDCQLSLATIYGRTSVLKSEDIGDFDVQNISGTLYGAKLDLRKPVSGYFSIIGGISFGKGKYARTFDLGSGDPDRINSEYMRVGVPLRLAFTKDIKSRIALGAEVGASAGYVFGRKDVYVGKYFESGSIEGVLENVFVLGVNAGTSVTYRLNDRWGIGLRLDAEYYSMEKNIKVMEIGGGFGVNWNLR
ncbi:hypothetical protein FUAX_52400 (plasmid) [Fulvitalea axinellae]|uniref:Outer membrane protein beta-barrel domain-containing protein n=1 Tax=Fulvitalea axinellae TaxID=1182444 RepID=A0AAU9CRM7_9BACT|nr:hypothetical protein FUAX_52400 [Fulvitalea axinellae]